MKSLLLLLSLCSLIAACNSGPPVPEAPASGLPWPVSSPAQEGVDSLVLDSIHQEISQGLYGLVDRFLVIRNGKILVDHTYKQNYDSVMVLFDTTNYQYNYDHTAWHPYYRDTDLHTMQSVTKSVTSVLFGIAVDEGLIPGVDTSAMAYFTGYDVDLSDERRQAMTLEDLLTMRSGIEWDEENYDEANNSCILMVAPEYDLIVAFNGWQHHGRPEKSTWMALEERILPGVVR